MKQRGKRIRPSGKDLVFHFTIASLLQWEQDESNNEKGRFNDEI